MTGIEQALLIILSAFLAIFLLLGIIATVKIIQIMNTMKRIAAKAEHITDNAETLSDIFVKSSGPIAVARLFAHIAETVFHKQDKKSKKEK